MKPIPLVRKAALAPAISYLAAEGIPVRRYLRRAKLSIPSAGTLETLIPLHQLCDFLNSVARAEGIDDLGFRIAGRQGIESLGTYGRLIAQSLTLHESVEISREMLSYYNSGLRIWLERHGDQVRYCQKYVETLPKDRITEVVQLGLANALATAGVQRRANWQPTRIELASEPIDLATHFPGIADVPVSFDQSCTSVWVHQRVLSKPMPQWDASAFPSADEKDRQMFVRTGPATDPIGQLEQAIESVLDHPELSLRCTAAIIGMSPRTLQRRLAEHDSTFSRMLQGVRFRCAQRLLHDPRMPLIEISKRLGYTDPANFMRAFKRWTGVGPNDFRRLHCEHDGR